MQIMAKFPWIRVAQENQKMEKNAENGRKKTKQEVVDF